MDIPALSMISAQTAVQSKAALLIMKQVMETSGQNGEALVDLLATTSPRKSPSTVGQTVDISV